MPSALRPLPRPVRLGEVLVAAAGQIDDRATDPHVGTGAGTVLTGITHDSRQVQPGDLYAALPGHVTHGARFAAAAVRSGAAAILTDVEGSTGCLGLGVPVVVVQRPRECLGPVAAVVYGHPSASLQMLGVTGTNGKTTVAAMVDAGLRAAGRTTGVIGTVGIQIAGQRHAGARTTPEATDLQAMLGVMRDAGVDTVVMEVSSIAIEEQRVDDIAFAVAGFTNLSQDHLDYHGTMEAYFEAKARLFTRDRAAAGVVGVDDEWGRRIAARATIPTTTWSLLDPSADWHARRGAGGIEVVGPDGLATGIQVPLPGAFNVANAVCAFAMLRTAGVGADAAAHGIGTTEVPGRMQVVGDAGGIRGIVDYAHSPDAIERVLRAAREDASGRVIAVVGAGGDRDQGKRPIMGATAARLADVVVFTDDNPRSEDPTRIRAALLDGARDVAAATRADIREEGDRMTAITVAVGLAEEGDVVLVLGKGHEQGQEVAGVVTAFDDTTALRQALAERAGS